MNAEIEDSTKSMRNYECGMWNDECGMMNAEYGMMNFEILKLEILKS